MSLPTLYSAELTRIPPVSVAFSPLRPNEAHGRMRMAFFTRAILAEAQNAVIALCNIPKNARIMRGFIFTSATPGATVNFDIGLVGRNLNGFIDDTVGATVADNNSYLGNFAPAAAAASGNFANTVAFHNGYIAAKDLILCAQVKGAAVTAASNLTGYVEYVVD